MNTTEFQSENAIRGDSAQDTSELKKMALAARNYISSFKWCPAINELFLAYGVGGVVAVFVLHFSKKIDDRDDYLWVVAGDLPSAYLVPDKISTAKQALVAYCDLMNTWTKSVLEKQSLDNAFPVAVNPTRENALALQKRIDFLRKRIIPQI